MHRLPVFGLLITLLALAPLHLKAQETERFYLSGTDKDNTKQWDFLVSEGRNAKKWSKIAVPSNWELQGFGTYEYGRKYRDGKGAWSKEYGLYKLDFTLPADWSKELTQRRIYLLFQGSMTDTEAKLNGKSCGPVHRGSFYPFRYEVTQLLKPGKNRLEVRVDKYSADTSVNRAERFADYWIFGGIFRPVLLESEPLTALQNLDLNAQADGKLQVQTGILGLKTGQAYELSTEVFALNANGKAGASISRELQPITSALLGNDTFSLFMNCKGVQPWSPENPVRYLLVTQLRQGKQVVHEIRKKIGFRTVELRPRDGIYVNGAKVIFKGVNRHSFWPSSGRTTSPALSVQDVQLMKDMNMNAVRMSHYPPDEHFLDVCDSLGLFVLDELGGWQKFYDEGVGRPLVKAMVERDRHHPSIVLWDNGNEGGHNPALAPVFQDYDLQKRPVIQPWSIFGNTDTQHYRPLNYGVGTLFQGRDIFFPTEFLHALYDGGGAAGLDDYWKLMRTNPLGAGGFIWAFCDECVVRRDKKDSLNCAGSDAPDGIVGPYREKEGSYHAIREIWSPVQFPQATLPKPFSGALQIRNEYLNTTLDQVSFRWQALQLGFGTRTNTTILASGNLVGPNLGPGATGFLNLPATARNPDADAIRILVTDRHGRHILTKTWMLHTPAEYRTAMLKREQQSTASTKATVQESDTTYLIQIRGYQYWIGKQSGMLVRGTYQGKELPMKNGPVLAQGTARWTKFKQELDAEGNPQLIWNGTEEGLECRWTALPTGTLKLHYVYRYHGTAPYLGINFSLGGQQPDSIKWLGKGPYRVWKNRLQGVDPGIHSKGYNDTRTGWEWNYPEFKGYHAELYWAHLLWRDGNRLTISTESEDLYLRLLTPSYASTNWNASNTQPPFPSGDLGFMHAIPPIGDKFLKPEQMGMQGQTNMLYSKSQHYVNMRATLYFHWDIP